jgi:translation initiation factor 2D
MFHKEGLVQLSSGGGGKKGSKAVDVALRKSDRRALRDRAVAYFLRESENDDDVKVNQATKKEGGDTLMYAQKIQAACDEIFLKGNLASRSLPAPGNEGNKATSMVLYLKTPSNDAETNTHWPFETSSQFVWMALEEKKTVVHETPTVALWAAMYPMVAAATEERDGVGMDSFAVVIPSAASKYLCRGADLMKAGMIQVPSSAIKVEGSSAMDTLNATRQKKRSDATFQSMVAVMVHGNPQPFAVGMCKLTTDKADGDNSTLFGPGTKGIGVEIWNCFGDDLWRSSNTKEQCMGTTHLNQLGGNEPFDNGHYGNVGFIKGQYVLPLVMNEETKDDISKGDEVRVEMDIEADSAKDPNASSIENASANNVADHPKDSQDDSPDVLLHRAFCQSLVNLKNKDLPMPSSTFYAQHVLQNRPEGTTINLKATSYKKFGNYLKEMASQDLIKVGPDVSNRANTDPMALLISYNRKHADLRPFSRTASVNEGGDGNGKKLVLVTLKIVPSYWTSLMRLDPDDVKALNASSEERKGTSMLTVSEVRKMLDKYIEREGLVVPNNPGEVVLDGPLTDAIYGKKTPHDEIPERITRKDLDKLYTSRHLPAYALVEMPGSKITKLARGSPPKVQIEVSQRQSNKFVTRVRGLEEYGIDPQYFCKDVKQRFAISASIDADPASSGHAALPKKGHVELVFGANIFGELEALLSGDESISSHGGVKNSEYSVPKQVLDVILKKGVPGRNKR